MTELHKYWFRFEKIAKPTAVNLGCGVTAYSEQDALELLRNAIFGANGPRRFLSALKT
jgi:hypothetical protein